MPDPAENTKEPDEELMDEETSRMLSEKQHSQAQDESEMYENEGVDSSFAEEKRALLDTNSYVEDSETVTPRSTMSRRSREERTRKVTPLELGDEANRDGEVRTAQRRPKILGMSPRSAFAFGAGVLAVFAVLLYAFRVRDVSPQGPEDDKSPFHMATVGDDWSKVLGEKPKVQDHTDMKSNGTHFFKNTVLIVSLDGVRAEYLQRELTPHLLAVSKKGIRAEYLESIFPTLTFPNHWAMQTGLYAESHGIIANDFWDPVDGEEFLYTDSSKCVLLPTMTYPEAPQALICMKGLGRPNGGWENLLLIATCQMWSTAVKNGLKSAVLMWPGPPEMQDGTRPTYFAPFQNHISWERKIDQIAEWIDMPDESRPQLICAYLPEVDQEGHHTGPDSPELKEKLRYVDDFAEAIYQLLQQRHLERLVDVIFVSDHGMTSTSDERIVYLDELLGEDGFAGIQHKSGWPLCELEFDESVDETLMVERMQHGAAQSKGGFAYYTPETMPSEWHYSANPRLAKHIIVPEVGWAITDKNEHFYEMKGHYEPLGNHGYNNSHPDMHAIFIAHGPFSERLRRKRMRLRNEASTTSIDIIPGFSNIQIYNLVTKTLLGLTKTAPNNGTEAFWDQYIIDD